MHLHHDKTHHDIASMRTSLLGKPLLSIYAANSLAVMPVIGSTIEEVEGFSRNLEITWDDGVVLRTKMRTSGHWHIHQSDEHARNGEQDPQIVIAVDGFWATCCGASEIESFHAFDQRRHPILGRLGPDLSDPLMMVDDCVEKMVNYHDQNITVAEVLLDQRVLRGVGNVFRCEVLWACEIHPWAKIGALSRDECREVVSICAEMLRASAQQNLVELAVYGKHGKSCSRCHGVVRVTHHGQANRVLYWCADCQTRHSQSASHVISHDTPPGVHPAEYIFLSELNNNRKSG